MKGLVGWSVVLALFILIIGCGGGGGGGGSTSSTTSTTSTTSTGTTSGSIRSPQVTLYVQPSNQMLDPHNLVVGDQAQLDITARDANNNLVIFPITGWTTTAPAGVATVTSSGLLTANGASTTAYVISGSYKGATYTSSLVVSAPQDFVTGTVEDIANNVTTPIEYGIVDFYDSTGKQVGSAFSARDGTFRASVPGSATQYTLDMSVADPGGQFYYSQFTYGPSSSQQEYLESASCLVALPGPLSSTVPTPLASPIVPYLRTLGPPPPPTGCVQ